MDHCNASYIHTFFGFLIIILFLYDVFIIIIIYIVVFVVPSEYRTTAVGKAALAGKYPFLMAWKDTVLATVCKY